MQTFLLSQKSYFAAAPIVYRRFCQGIASNTLGLFGHNGIYIRENATRLANKLYLFFAQIAPILYGKEIYGLSIAILLPKTLIQRGRFLSRHGTCFKNVLYQMFSEVIIKIVSTLMIGITVKIVICVILVPIMKTAITLMNLIAVKIFILVFLLLTQNCVPIL